MSVAVVFHLLFVPDFFSILDLLLKSTILLEQLKCLLHKLEYDGVSFLLNSFKDCCVLWQDGCTFPSLRRRVSVWKISCTMWTPSCSIFLSAGLFRSQTAWCSSCCPRFTHYKKGELYLRPVFKEMEYHVFTANALSLSRY